MTTLHFVYTQIGGNKTIRWNVSMDPRKHKWT